MKRIYSIDLFKLVFAYVIAFFHYGTTISPGPTAAVQIFFLISGFFLARKYYSRSHADGGKIYSGRGTSTDIVGSAIAAYISAINKITYEEA